jgi:hypothetical protein
MAIQTEPTRIQIPFADSGTKNVIPDTNSTPSASQAASWTDGFPAQCSLPLSAGGIPPARADFNGIFNTMTQSERFTQEGGVWAWDATVDYGTSRVVLGSDGKLYWSIAQSGPNVGGAQDPTTDNGTYWGALPAKALSAAKGITIGGLEVAAVENTAAAHNGIYRGKDLTSIYSLDDLHTKMQNNDWTDLYIGDFITKPVSISYSGTLDGETITVSYSGNMRFRFAHFDYWWEMGDTALTSHHILLVPGVPFFNTKMRKTNTTSGGIPGSNVWYLLQNVVFGAVNAASCMNGRLLQFRDWISDTVDANAPSTMGGGVVGSSALSPTMWRDVKCGLLHEPMVYGGPVCSSSGYDTGCGNTQLAFFRLDSTAIQSGASRSSYWLSAVSSSESFAHVGAHGGATNYSASSSDGVRPFFLLG